MDPQRARQARNRIRDNFDRGAEAYGRFEEGTSFFGGLLAALLELGPPLAGRRVLDVGCGTGASLAGLQRAVGPGGQVWGIDLSLGMLRQARARLGPGAGLAALDGCDYGSAFRAIFDAVVYNAVLFLLPDAAASLESARRVLAPGGAVLVSHLEGVSVPGLGRSVPDLLAERGFQAGRHALSPWDKARSELEARFAEVSVRRWVVDLSPEEFLAFYGLEPMSAGLLPGLPYPERRRAVEALAGELAEQGHRVEQVWNLACGRRPG
ncbi:MAG: class I SAM-dependent methyltransferase [Deferrisomatales bacterium]